MDLDLDDIFQKLATTKTMSNYTDTTAGRTIVPAEDDASVTHVSSDGTQLGLRKRKCGGIFDDATDHQSKDIKQNAPVSEYTPSKSTTPKNIPLPPSRPSSPSEPSPRSTPPSSAPFFPKSRNPMIDEALEEPDVSLDDCLGIWDKQTTTWKRVFVPGSGEGQHKLNGASSPVDREVTPEAKAGWDYLWNNHRGDYWYE